MRWCTAWKVGAYQHQGTAQCYALADGQTNSFSGRSTAVPSHSTYRCSWWTLVNSIFGALSLQSLCRAGAKDRLSIVSGESGRPPMAKVGAILAYRCSRAYGWFVPRWLSSAHGINFRQNGWRPQPPFKTIEGAMYQHRPEPLPVETNPIMSLTSCVNSLPR